MASEMLVIDDLSISYVANGGKVDVCRSVSFEVRPGEILGLFGPNGCGKTTLLRSIVGLVSRDSGAICIPSNGNGPTRLAIIPQNYRESFFRWSRLLNSIRLTLPSPVRRWRANGRVVEKTKAELGIDVNLNLKPQVCSGGMLQQAAIIRAFASNPHLIIADEPFSALDVEIAGRVRREFRRLVQEKKIIAIVVLHNLEDIVEVCDRVLVIPNKPFSIEGRDGCHHAKVICNSTRRDDTEDARCTSFVDIAERILKDGVC